MASARRCTSRGRARAVVRRRPQRHVDRGHRDPRQLQRWGPAHRHPPLGYGVRVHREHRDAPQGRRRTGRVPARRGACRARAGYLLDLTGDGSDPDSDEAPPPARRNGGRRGVAEDESDDLSRGELGAERAGSHGSCSRGYDYKTGASTLHDLCELTPRIQLDEACPASAPGRGRMGLRPRRGSTPRAGTERGDRLLDLYAVDADGETSRR